MSVILHIDPFYSPSIYEIVDVCAAPSGADGVVHVRLRQSMSPGQRLIDINLELSNILLSKDANTVQSWILCRSSQQLIPRSEERRVGKECVIRVDIGGRRIIKKKKKDRDY